MRIHQFSYYYRREPEPVTKLCEDGIIVINGPEIHVSTHGGSYRYILIADTVESGRIEGCIIKYVEGDLLEVEEVTTSADDLGIMHEKWLATMPLWVRDAIRSELALLEEIL